MTLKHSYGRFAISAALIAELSCATTERDESPQQPVTLDDAGDAAADALSEAGLSDDPDASSRSMDSGSIVDAGPPPTSCIPPCLWDLFVQCKVPGAGGPRPSEGTCIQDIRGMAVCDPTTGFVATMDGAAFYLEGMRCFTEGFPMSGAGGSGTGWPGTPEPYLRFTDASGRVIADESDPFDRGGPHDLYCGAYDDPAAAVYQIELGSPECVDVWRRVMIFPMESGCVPGLCPDELLAGAGLLVDGG